MSGETMPKQPSNSDSRNATPETTGARRINIIDPSLPLYIVDVEVAEKLERERDEARRQWFLYKDMAAELHIRLIDANRELENLRCLCRRLIKYRGHIADDEILDMIAEMLPDNATAQATPPVNKSTS